MSPSHHVLRALHINPHIRGARAGSARGLDPRPGAEWPQIGHSWPLQQGFGVICVDLDPLGAIDGLPGDPRRTWPKPTNRRKSPKNGRKHTVSYIFEVRLKPQIDA